MQTTAPSPEILFTPEALAAKKLALMEDLKARKSRTTVKYFWESFGFNIPTVDTIEEASELADQGLPSYVKVDDLLRFAPELLVAEAEAARKELEAEYVASEAEREKLPNRLKSVTDMLKTPEIDWLVEDKIHRTGLCQIYGASYAGKTLVVLDLVMSWCAGLPEWQGYKLNNDGKPQDAVYVAAEGGAAVSVHVDAWLKYHDDVDRSRLDGLLFLDGGEGHHMFLGIGKEQPEIGDSWMTLVREVNERDITPSLIVFDTQIDLAPGIDENSNTDMVGVLREVKRLGDSLGFMAIVIHHTGHDGNKARGASGMMGKCDSQAKLTVIGEKSGKARLEWTKVKGRAIPKDSISYHIQGTAFLPDLNSEGAVCVPIGAMEAGLTEMTSIMPAKDLQDRIMSAINQDTLSIRALADAVNLDRAKSEFKNALIWMEWSKMISIDKTNPKAHKVCLAPFALAPSSSDID